MVVSEKLVKVDGQVKTRHKERQSYVNEVQNGLYVTQHQESTKEPVANVIVLLNVHIMLATSTLLIHISFSCVV